MRGRDAPPAGLAGGGGQTKGPRALIVFHGERARWWACFLKPGFRHCFAAIDHNGYWIVFDPRQGLVELKVATRTDYDLAAFYREKGYTVAEITQGTRPSLAPLMPATCVSAVKRLLAIRAPFALTPWGLWRRLS